MLPFIWKKFNVGVFHAWYCQVPRSLILISKAFEPTHKALLSVLTLISAKPITHLSFQKKIKIIRLGVRALSFWRVNEYVKLILLEKATNPHPQLKREFMIFALIPEVNQTKVGASAQHTDSRVKFTLT